MKTQQSKRKRHQLHRFLRRRGGRGFVYRCACGELAAVKKGLRVR